MEWVGLHVFSPHRRNVQWCNFILISFCPHFVHVNPFRISSSSNLLSVLIILTENSLTLPSSPVKIHSMNWLISALTISFPRSGAGVAQGKRRHRAAKWLSASVPKQKFRGISIRDSAGGPWVPGICGEARGVPGKPMLRRRAPSDPPLGDPRDRGESWDKWGAAAPEGKSRGFAHLGQQLDVALVTTTSGPKPEAREVALRKVHPPPRGWGDSAPRAGRDRQFRGDPSAAPEDSQKNPVRLLSLGWVPWTPSSASPTRPRAGTDSSGESGARGL